MIHRTENRITWLRKGWDLKHGFGWFCQVYGKDYGIGFGYSKNKFTAFRLALKELGENF
jgi:hypothetical protein